MPNDIYFKVGLIAIIGLSAKKRHPDRGIRERLFRRSRNLKDSAVEAAKIRFRPIIMTSLACALGVVPLAIATGPRGEPERIAPACWAA